MGDSTEQFAHELMSGQRRGIMASLLRGVLRITETPYAMLMRVRNGLYDAGALKSHRLAMPVISVGNITAGGTGKTPMVQWLVAQLWQRGMKPAVLMRGYRRGASGVSDEQSLLSDALATPQGATIVHAEPDRVAAAQRVLREHAEVDSFVLDDGFQHRRLARDFDLVLIDATRPFGYGHVHPRGLLREPMTGLRRADAFVLTRSDLTGDHECRRITSVLRTHNPSAPVYRARHEHVGLRSVDATLPLETLRDKRFYAAAGIANPAGLQQQLAALPGSCVGFRAFADHHDYSQSDLAALRQTAGQAGAQMILVTEKDWAKLKHLPGARDEKLPFFRLDLRLAVDGGSGLVDLIEARIESQRSAGAAQA